MTSFFYTLQGLGMVVTGTLPVFNLTMKGNSQVIKGPDGEALVVPVKY